MKKIEYAALTLGHQQVDVVAADEVVREADDGALQARLPVVVRRVRRHKARQLRHLSRHPQNIIVLQRARICITRPFPGLQESFPAAITALHPSLVFVIWLHPGTW